MVKKKSMVTVIIIMLAFVLNSLSFVSALAGVKVNIRIEGYDKTIISKDVYAYNFSDALKALSNNDNIDIQLKTTGADISINSINGVENGFFGGSDKWFSVIEREGQLISENALNSTLKEGDKLVVYYGEFAKTEWLSKLSVESSGGEAKFFAQAQNDEWVMKDGQWTVDGEMRP
ncbi:hypothetical protein LJB89_04565, partial [Tyzzerella sp. OttesenSCG-928-J15]|nr:hypothetical protein [Tyzzerella sp. OttesenSCG-928-J15]